MYRQPVPERLLYEETKQHWVKGHATATRQQRGHFRQTCKIKVGDELVEWLTFHDIKHLWNPKKPFLIFFYDEKDAMHYKMRFL